MRHPGPFVLPPDALGHDGLATSLIRNVARLRPGSVVAVQGPWGRGKTDVLKRLFNAAASDAHAEVTWVNPWQYGTPDLISPVLTDLLERAESHFWTGDAQRKILPSVRSLIRAAATRAGEAVGIGREVVEASERLVTQLYRTALGRVPEEAKAEALPDADPVRAMGRRFCEFLDQVGIRPPDRRLVVCVDDIDRCLPHRQVALLEAIHFLVSSQAPAYFVVAIDPTLVRQAVVTHYGTDRFDPDRYLDKIIDLRVPLPALSSAGVSAMVEGILHSGTTGPQADWATSLFGDHGPNLQALAHDAFALPALRSPRIIERTLQRLSLLGHSTVAADVAAHVKSERHAVILLQWMIIIETWPELRVVCQDAEADFSWRLWNLLRTVAGGIPDPGNPGDRVRLETPPVVSEVLQLRADKASLAHIVQTWPRTKRGGKALAGTMQQTCEFVAAVDGHMCIAGL